MNQMDADAEVILQKEVALSRLSQHTTTDKGCLGTRFYRSATTRSSHHSSNRSGVNQHLSALEWQVRLKMGSWSSRFLEKIDK